MSGETYFVLPVLSLARRELTRFYRQRSRVIGTLGTPFLFWIFLGSGLGSAFPSPNTPSGGGYLEYFYPGIVLLTILFTSIFSNISLIEDRHEGFLQSVLVAPVSRWAVVGGKVSGGAFLALLQGICFLLLAPFAGISLSFTGACEAILTLFLISLSLSALGFYFAWKLDSVQGFHGIMNLVLMPMWLLSGAFFPLAKAPVWLKPIMYLNPLTYGLDSLKQALYRGHAPLTSTLSFPVAILVSALFGLLFYTLALVAVVRGRKESYA